MLSDHLAKVMQKSERLMMRFVAHTENQEQLPESLQEKSRVSETEKNNGC
jgi:hypothetical protein